MRLAILVGRAVRALARARGGGSAIPGRIAMMIDPNFLEHTIGAIPGGVVFVTGSNGKSTTTAMLVALVRQHGWSVFTNPAGSNLPQGLASAVLADASLSGHLSAQIAILEVDEAYGPHIAQRLTPDSLVVTNLQLDQLNRFGEPERVWQMMRTVAEATRTTILVNDREPALLALATDLELSGGLATVSVDQAVLDAHPGGLNEVVFGDSRGQAVSQNPPVVSLRESSGQHATIVDHASHESHAVTLPAPGLHWAIDATIAVGMARVLLGQKWSWDLATTAFDRIPPVYGRGETITYRGRDFSLLMQKNLPSMRANLSTITTQPECVWVAVDEGTPDPSWIFDVDLGPIGRIDVLSGSKAWQWATFLAYRGVELGTIIDGTKAAMDFLSAQPNRDHPVTAIVNYEQMMASRRIAGHMDLESRQ